MDWPAPSSAFTCSTTATGKSSGALPKRSDANTFSRPVHNGAFVNFNNARDYNQQAVGFNVRYLFHDAPMTLERRCRRFPIGADSSPSSCRSSASSHFVLESSMSATLLTGP